jgi:hypothetical protein
MKVYQIKFLIGLFLIGILAFLIKNSVGRSDKNTTMLDFLFSKGSQHALVTEEEGSKQPTLNKGADPVSEPAVNIRSNAPIPTPVAQASPPSDLDTLSSNHEEMPEMSASTNESQQIVSPEQMKPLVIMQGALRDFLMSDEALPSLLSVERLTPLILERQIGEKKIVELVKLTEGNLIADHWGSALRVHFFSRNLFSVQSNGPDRKLGTEDDFEIGYKVKQKKGKQRDNAISDFREMVR